MVPFSCSRTVKCATLDNRSPQACVSPRKGRMVVSHCFPQHCRTPPVETLPDLEQQPSPKPIRVSNRRSAMTRGRIAIVAGTLLALGACSEPPADGAHSACSREHVRVDDRCCRKSNPPIWGALRHFHYDSSTPRRRSSEPPAAAHRVTCVSCSIWGVPTAIAEQIVTFTGPTTAIASNTTTYTAANGDSALRFLDRHECQRRAPGDVQRA